MNQAILARHLGKYQRTDAEQDTHTDRFFASAGAGNLSLHSDAGDNGLADEAAMVQARGIRLVSTGAKVFEQA